VGVGGKKPRARSRHTAVLYHHYLVRRELCAALSLTKITQIMYGGSDRSDFFDDMWVLDLDKLVWIQVCPSSEPDKSNEKGKAKEKEGKEKGEEKEKETEKEKEKEADREETSGEETNSSDIFWPKGRRDHEAVIHSSRVYHIGGKERAAYATDYLISYDCRKLSTIN